MKKLLTMTLIMISFSSLANSQTDEILLVKSTDFQAIKASEQNFSGDVKVKMLFPQNSTTNMSTGVVTFEPNARTNWHSHPKGQTLYILSGKGLIQQWGGEIIEVSRGDSVWFPPHIKHWHGAATDSAMSHLSFAPIDDGKSSDWQEKVTNEQHGE